MKELLANRSQEIPEEVWGIYDSRYQARLILKLEKLSLGTGVDPSVGKT